MRFKIVQSINALISNPPPPKKKNCKTIHCISFTYKVIIPMEKDFVNVKVIFLIRNHEYLGTFYYLNIFGSSKILKVKILFVGQHSFA